MGGFEKIQFIGTKYHDILTFNTIIYDPAEENLVTAFVPSDTACFANSPGNIKRTDVWISRDDKVAFLLYVASFPASVAIRSKISLMNEFMIDIAFLLIPVSGCTCLRTLKMYVEYDSTRFLLRFLVAAAFGALVADLLGVFAMITIIRCLDAG